MRTVQRVTRAVFSLCASLKLLHLEDLASPALPGYLLPTNMAWCPGALVRGKRLNQSRGIEKQFLNYEESEMNRSFRNLGVLCFVAVLFLLVSSTSNAQTFRGTILGTVTDSSGAAVPGVTVTIKNVDTGLTRTVVTSDDGSYSVPELPIGNYNVSAQKEGFKEAVASGVKVEVSSERRVDFTLQPGQLAQRIEVVGEELPMVESTSNTLGGIVESNVVTNLPVNGRDYQKLILLVPGAASGPDAITDSAGSYGTVSVNGARGRSNNYLLDGTDMNDGYRNDPAINEGGVFSTPATILPVEAIAEMHIASNFEAEYGRSAGSAINIVTKSGTNNFHGSAFDFFRNTDLNARNFFDLASAGPQQPFHLNQFGGTIGGPIVHDKTFFFVDYEGVRETGAQSSPGCVPTAADIAANTPAGGINPVIQKLLALNPWPKPTNANDCYAGGASNITIATPFSNRVDNAIVKVDHNFNKDNLLTGRYYIGDSTQLFPLALTGGGDLPNYNTLTPTRVQLISISYVSVISPSVVNEARIGWNRFAEGFFPEDRNFDPYSIGLNTVGPGTANAGNPYNFGMPVINVSGLPQLGSDKGDPRQRVDTNWHYIDNVSWKTGKHEIKLGYEFRRTSVSQIFNRVFRGRLDFPGSSTENSLQEFLAGTPNPSILDSRQGSGDTNRNTFENSQAFYLQDSYRVSHNFTVNLGLRYDYFGIVQEKHDMFNNVDPTTGAVFAVGPGRLYQPDYNNWAPRLSVAWDVSGHQKTVVRAGYGIFYDATSQDMFMGHLPFSTLFDPGPAYSGLPGVGQILIGTPLTDASGNALPIMPNQPVFGNYAPMPDEFGIDPHIRTPYLQNYNLNVQQQLTRNMVLQVGYVGSHGSKLWDFRDINQPSFAQIWAADCAGVTPLPAVGQPCPGGTILDFNTPRRLTGTSIYNYIYWQESAAKSNYNALQTTYSINNWHGLTSSFNFTWSHSIDTASDGEDYVPNAAQPSDSTQPQLNRGNSNFDTRKRLTWNFIYQFPNRQGSFQRLTNGWGLNGILTVQSGMPFHMILENDDYDGSGTDFPTPDVIGPIKYNSSDPTQFLALSSFAVPCTPVAAGFNGAASSCEPGTRHFGNEARNSLVGPPFRQLDFSIYKNTNITEKVKLELRFEFYNLLNHPNFANPLWPNFGSDPSYYRVTLPAGCSTWYSSNGHLCGFLPLTTTADVGPGYPFLGGGGPRSIQLAAKFTF
jgi:Carboxypeptidase regulatory-like domain/TonB dependent receptor-like, beta-barrel